MEYVEADVTCQSQTETALPHCAVERMRRMRHPDVNANITAFDYINLGNLASLPSLINS
jgi:hypothetical protein